MENALGQIPKKELWSSMRCMIKLYRIYLKKGLQGMCLNKMFTNDLLVKKIQFVFYDDTSIGSITFFFRYCIIFVLQRSFSWVLNFGEKARLEMHSNYV